MSKDKSVVINLDGFHGDKIYDIFRKQESRLVIPDTLKRISDGGSFRIEFRELDLVLKAYCAYDILEYDTQFNRDIHLGAISYLNTLYHELMIKIGMTVSVKFAKDQKKFLLKCVSKWGSHLDNNLGVLTYKAISQGTNIHLTKLNICILEDSIRDTISRGFIPDLSDEELTELVKYIKDKLNESKERTVTTIVNVNLYTKTNLHHLIRRYKNIRGADNILTNTKWRDDKDSVIADEVEHHLEQTLLDRIVFSLNHARCIVKAIDCVSSETHYTILNCIWELRNKLQEFIDKQEGK